MRRISGVGVAGFGWSCSLCSVGILVVLLVSACAPEPPPATPTPTVVPTPTPWAEVEEALEELFWMSVDWVGEDSGMTEINRTMSFELAKETVRLYLFVIFEGYASDIESRGMTPFDTVPFCFDLIIASMNMVEFSQALSPSDAAPHINHASVALSQLVPFPESLTIIREIR